MIMSDKARLHSSAASQQQPTWDVYYLFGSNLLLLLDGDWTGAGDCSKRNEFIATMGYLNCISLYDWVTSSPYGMDTRLGGEVIGYPYLFVANRHPIDDDVAMNQLSMGLGGLVKCATDKSAAPKVERHKVAFGYYLLNLSIDSSPSSRIFGHVRNKVWRWKKSLVVSDDDHLLFVLLGNFGAFTIRKKSIYGRRRRSG